MLSRTKTPTTKQSQKQLRLQLAVQRTAIISVWYRWRHFARLLLGTSRVQAILLPVKGTQGAVRMALPTHYCQAPLSEHGRAPAPTVRPPSRMANRRPGSMGTGWMSSKLAVTLSPGITISTPSGSSTLPARQACAQSAAGQSLFYTHCGADSAQHAHKLLTLWRSAKAHVWPAHHERFVAGAAMTGRGNKYG